MLPTLPLQFLATAGLTSALHQRRSVSAEAVCYPGEVQTLLCYKRPQGTPQDVEVDDIAYTAAALREYATGLQERLDSDGDPVLDEDGISVEEPLYRFLNMTGSKAPDCGEWTIFTFETVLVAAKLMTSRKNSLVWYGDIANTIDGGAAPSDKDKKAAIIGCGTDGGSNEVKADLTHPAYTPYLDLYKTGAYVATDIVIKVVQNIEYKKDPNDK